MTTTTTKLDPRIKEAWMGALLGGEYEQGKGSLRSKGDRFCCLGVLCDVLGAEWVETGGAFSPVFDGVAGPTHYLHPAVQEATGLSSGGTLPVVIDDRKTLAGLNDGARKTFAEIAAIIDKHL